MEVGASLVLEMEAGTAAVGYGTQRFALRPLRGIEDDSLHLPVPA
jgi:hypothetical protein